MHSLVRFFFCISGLKNLEVLYLDKTSVSDEGASVIKCKFYVVQKCIWKIILWKKMGKKGNKNFNIYFIF